MAFYIIGICRKGTRGPQILRESYFKHKMDNTKTNAIVKAAKVNNN